MNKAAVSFAALVDRVTLPTRGHTAALARYSRRRAFFWLGNKITTAPVSYAVGIVPAKISA
jgi:hypothetical protein